MRLQGLESKIKGRGGLGIEGQSRVGPAAHGFGLLGGEVAAVSAAA